jgi:DNA polymerase-3 subunit delta'
VKFSDIVGQKTAKKFLGQVMASAKIPHAYLFTGIPGVGKSSTAMAFAMALNCKEPKELDGCGLCPSCRQLLGGNHPDFISISPENQNIGIEKIKELNRGLSFAPMSGRYRVCVIHQAEAMSEEAANSFLKTLEEPPPGNILILKVMEPLDLLPTIVSRCQKVPFRPLTVREITQWLVNNGIEKDAALLLAGISGGSLGRALKMSGGDFLEKRNTWLGRLEKLPALSKVEALNMALECAEEDRKKGIDISSSGEAGMLDMLSAWTNWYRDLLVLKVGGPVDLLINGDFAKSLNKLAENYKIDALVDSILLVDQAQSDIRRMRNPILAMEHAVLGLKGLCG